MAKIGKLCHLIKSGQGKNSQQMTFQQRPEGHEGVSWQMAGGQSGWWDSWCHCSGVEHAGYVRGAVRSPA